MAKAKKKHKYVAIYSGYEAPTVLTMLLLGLMKPEANDEVVHASSMEEACLLLDCEYVKDDSPKWAMSEQFVYWDTSEGHEGNLIIRADLFGALKSFIQK